MEPYAWNRAQSTHNADRLQNIRHNDGLASVWVYGIGDGEMRGSFVTAASATWGTCQETHVAALCCCGSASNVLGKMGAVVGLETPSCARTCSKAVHQPDTTVRGLLTMGKKDKLAVEGPASRPARF